MRPEIQIVLATYKGEKFLPEQIDSILAQTHTNWQIIARDDGSPDLTRAILRAYAMKHGDKIKLIEDGDTNLGCCGNFARLMEHTTAPYVAFADQDDVWHPDKLEKSLAQLKAMEAAYGETTPLLVHHDISIIDANGQPVAPSFEKKYKVGKANSSIEHMLVQPIVHGFAALGNRALIDKSLPLHAQEDAHDNYVSMVAAVFGKIGYNPNQLADYRIHGANVAGGNNPFYSLRTKGVLGLIFGGHAMNDVRKLMDAARSKQEEKCAAAERFLEQHGDVMTPEQREPFELFSRLTEVGKLERSLTLVQHGFLPTSRRLKAAYVALC